MLGTPTVTPPIITASQRGPRKLLGKAPGVVGIVRNARSQTNRHSGRLKRIFSIATRKGYAC
jgi:hypothetical protein